MNCPDRPLDPGPLILASRNFWVRLFFEKYPEHRFGCLRDGHIPDNWTGTGLEIQTGSPGPGLVLLGPVGVLEALIKMNQKSFH